MYSIISNFLKRKGKNLTPCEEEILRLLFTSSADFFQKLVIDYDLNEGCQNNMVILKTNKNEESRCILCFDGNVKLYQVPMSAIKTKEFSNINDNDCPKNGIEACFLIDSNADNDSLKYECTFTFPCEYRSVSVKNAPYSRSDFIIRFPSNIVGDDDVMIKCNIETENDSNLYGVYQVNGDRNDILFVVPSKLANGNLLDLMSYLGTKVSDMYDKNLLQPATLPVKG